MIRRLFSGWFNPMNVSPLEGFFMRLLFACALIFTVRVTGQFNFPTEPHPVGLLKILHRLADGPGVTDHDNCRTWLTWLADADKFVLYRWCYIGVLAFYVAGIALPIVLPVAALMQILPYTLFGSQEYNYHGAAMISTVLLAQAITVIYYSITQRFTLSPPDGRLRYWLLVQSMMIVTGAYFISVIAKMEYSHGGWFMNSNNVALDMIKTERQTFFNHNMGPPAGVTDEELKMVGQIGLLDVMFHAKSYPIHVIATWMLEHPWTGRILFGSGVLLEIVCILGIGNRALALFFGLCLIAFHRTIDVLMGGVQFPFNELCDFIFLVGLPFGFAWLFHRIKNPVVRYATLGGAAAGMIASYWIHPWTGRAGESLGNYFLAMVSTVFGVWSSHDWAGFFEDVKPVAALALAGGIVGAVCAKLFGPGRAPNQPALV